ncbi:MAG: UDP-glucose/GDP-mannose dehydrogenase family protein [Dehalococcoidales bacterium]|nr:UDP-glucose/GDP-mannose dehydrogenase family protein [Dehalococcoidales bacterium]
MRISIVGAGYVGCATGAGLAKLGHEVTFVDSNKEKVDTLSELKCPVYEKDVEAILKSSRVRATCDLEYAVRNTEVSFICVATNSTPSGGSIDLSQIKEVAEQIGKALSNYHLVVVKSTVLPGTTENVIVPLLERHSKKVKSDFQICVNPEFLREGFAVEDFLHPYRVIIGEIDKKGGDILVELYKHLDSPIVRCDLRTAELIKYASNAFLAMKLSFMNEIGNMCKKLGIDVYEVAKGMGYDERIGNKFLNAGIGFGGSCLPKDVRALMVMGGELGYKPRILEEVLNLNEQQPLRMLELLKKHIPNLNGKKIGILGLAFKADTDDVRESRAITIVDALLREGAVIRAYDPVAMRDFKRLFPDIKYTGPEEVLQCDAILILTDWHQFNSFNYKGKIVIDGKRINKARESKIYEGICW